MPKIKMREKRTKVVHVLDMQWAALMIIKDDMQERTLKTVTIEELVQDALDEYIKTKGEIL